MDRHEQFDCDRWFINYQLSSCDFRGDDGAFSDSDADFRGEDYPFFLNPT